MFLGFLQAVPPTTGTFDFLFNWYLFFGVGAAVVVISMLTFFMIRYRAKGSDNTPIHHKTEGWKIVLITVLITLSVLTAAEYQTFASFSNIEIPSQCTQVPDPCITIKVVGFQWGWNFTYPNGKFAVTTLNQPLTLPAGKIVVFNITSRDVFHSFGITMFGQKEDAIPGRTNQMWVEATQTGTYIDAVRCFELCGAGHAFMIGNLTVTDYTSWQAQFGGNA